MIIWFVILFEIYKKNGFVSDHCRIINYTHDSEKSFGSLTSKSKLNKILHVHKKKTKKLASQTLKKAHFDLILRIYVCESACDSRNFTPIWNAFRNKINEI